MFKEDRTKREPVPLAGILREYVEQQHLDRPGATDRIRAAWQKVLPVEMADHCRLGGFRDGSVRVLVDASAYLYELRLSHDELLMGLKRLCPGAGIRKIVFTIG